MKQDERTPFDRALQRARLAAYAPGEFDVLAFLAARPDEVHSREEILDRIWGDAFLAASRSLDVHVAGIRAKTGRSGLVRTVRGFGYQLGTSPARDDER